jgi:hypothetical protein
VQFYRLFVVQLEAAEAAVKEAEQIRKGDQAIFSVSQAILSIFSNDVKVVPFLDILQDAKISPKTLKSCGR